MSPHRSDSMRLPSTRASGPWVGPIAFASVTLAYLLFAQLVQWLNDPVAAGAGLWPAAGVTLAALLMLPGRAWGWVVAAIVVAELGGDLAHEYPVAASLGWTLGNVLEPLAGAFLIRRFASLRGAHRPVGMLALFLAFGVLVGPLIGASVSASTTALAFGLPLAEVWPKYFIEDALGVLVVAPAVLTMLAPRTGRRRREAVALVLISLAACAAVFTGWGGPLLTKSYLLMPCLAWAALRFGVPGVAWLAFGLTMIANAATAYGGGPFAESGLPSDQSITLLQVFLAVSVSSSLLLATLADHVAYMERTEADWRHQATHDLLTGLPNRGYLDIVLHDAFSESSATEPVRLVMCDLDNFKVVNDTWGHAAGDELLQVIAARLKGAVRSNDVVARISGDEFVLLLRDTGEVAAAQAASRVLAAVAKPVLLTGAGVVVPSVSLGLALHHEGESVGRLMARADATMYRAKALGGGRIEHE